jgi:glyoxylase-like metal-dependent hydrolase (beta-lactamase superfamily II)
VGWAASVEDQQNAKKEREARWKKASLGLETSMRCKGILVRLRDSRVFSSLFAASLIAFFCAAISNVTAAAPMVGEEASRKVTKLADGVYAIEHPGHRHDGMFSGNTTVIIGTRQVLVVDSAYLPEVTRADIAQIHEWTNKPVCFVLNTHFHNDHNLGNSLYMEAYPAVTIIAHTVTKQNMDMFGPGSSNREQRVNARLQTMLDEGKGPDGQPLSAEEKAYLKQAIAERIPLTDEIKQVRYQSATMTFDHDITIDLGEREVQVKFLGRGNTGGDAVAYLPKEKIAVVGDLVGYPIPMANDGYPSEWTQTLQNLSQLDADKIVPGHGPVLYDKAQILLYRELLINAEGQMNAKLTQAGPAMSRTLDEVKGSMDLSAYKEKFTRGDASLDEDWNDFTSGLIKTMFEEASLR